MNNKTAFFLILAFTIPQLAKSSKSEELNIENLQVSPEIISSTGKNRIRDHIATIEQNIAHTETNLQATKKNIEVIESELKDLDDLEKEHLRLKERYTDFLAYASKQTLKNEKALKEIEEFQKKVEKLSKSNQNEAQINELKTATTEKAEREDWLKDTNQKTARVQELLLGVEKNLKSIASRKHPLQEQLQTWKNKNIEYTQLLSKLTNKKAIAERFVASQSKDSK